MSANTNFVRKENPVQAFFVSFLKSEEHPLQDKINEELGNLQIGKSITRMGQRNLLKIAFTKIELT